MIQKYIVQTTEKIEYYSNTWIFVQKERPFLAEQPSLLIVNLLIEVGLITNLDFAMQLFVHCLSCYHRHSTSHPRMIVESDEECVCQLR